MASFADEISRLTNPNPVFQDPEDVDDITSAQVVGRDNFQGDFDNDDNVPVTSTKLRRQAAKLLADEDSRYAGKKTSRKRLQEANGPMKTMGTGEMESDESGDGDEEEDSEEEEEESEEEEEESEEMDVGEGEDEDEDDVSDDDLASFKEKMIKSVPRPGKAEFSFEDDGDYSKFASDEDEEEESGDDEDERSEESDDDEDDDSEEEEDGEEEEGEGGISAFSKSRLDEEVKKGEAVRIQLNVWDQLLKARIELQKVLVLVNRLPQQDTWNHFTNQGGEEYGAALKEAQNAVKSMVDKAYMVQTELLGQHNDTQSLVQDVAKQKEGDKKKPADDDEEITSDEDDAGSVQEKPVKEAASQSRKRKRKHPLHEYPSLLMKRHKAFTTYRDDTIQKWFDKTKVASGKLKSGFSAFEQSALKQIKQILSDRDRLIKRTQLRRSTYLVLGEPETSSLEQEKADEHPEDDAPPQTIGRENTKDYNEEIFDDDDFYHQLLRELIQRKTSDINDPIALSRQWLELQKLRSKVKKKVDTRASKGRKIRYHILPKLVNFMAPNDTSSWTDEAKDDLFRSLFGKRGNGESEAAATS